MDDPSEIKRPIESPSENRKINNMALRCFVWVNYVQLQIVEVESMKCGTVIVENHIRT
jgi:hypothetical protein